MSTTYFEEKDFNGMACILRTEWASGGDDAVRILSYFADGKLQEDRYDYDEFCGVRYEYDLKGDVSQKQAYYDGALESTVFYEYDGEQLCAVYSEDAAGNLLFECVVENGLIVRVDHYGQEDEYSFVYEYDENGNPTACTFEMPGETCPAELYYYRAVEVDSQRAWCLRYQQNYLVPIV